VKLTEWSGMFTDMNIVVL